MLANLAWVFIYCSVLFTTELPILKCQYALQNLGIYILKNV